MVSIDKIFSYFEFEKDPEFKILETQYYEIPESDSNVVFKYFVYGPSTFAKMLELPFSCQRCGSCCTQIDICEYFEKQNDLGRCKIHDDKEYSFSCHIYPFSLDNSAHLCGGKLEYRNNELFTIQLGILTGLLQLQIYHRCPGWIEEGKPLKDSLYTILGEMLYLPEETRILPHKKSLVKFYGSSNGTEKISISELEKRFKELIENKKSEIQNYMGHFRKLINF